MKFLKMFLWIIIIFAIIVGLLMLFISEWSSGVFCFSVGGLLYFCLKKSSLFKETKKIDI